MHSIFSQPAAFAASTAALPPCAAASSLPVPMKETTSGASKLVSTAKIGVLVPFTSVAAWSPCSGAMMMESYAPDCTSVSIMFCCSSYAVSEVAPFTSTVTPRSFAAASAPACTYCQYSAEVVLRIILIFAPSALPPPEPAAFLSSPPPEPPQAHRPVSIAPAKSIAAILFIFIGHSPFLCSQHSISLVICCVFLCMHCTVLSRANK